MGDSVGCDGLPRAVARPVQPGGVRADRLRARAARARGIRIIPTIVGDDARDGGTGCVYLRWRGISVPDCSIINMAPFWTDPTVIGDVEEHIKALLDHVNVYTGVAYKDDPTILGWDLLNGGGSPTPWTRQIAGYVRCIDPHHLILSGAANVGNPRRRRVRLFVYPHWTLPLAVVQPGSTPAARGSRTSSTSTAGTDQLPTRPHAQRLPRNAPADTPRSPVTRSGRSRRTPTATAGCRSRPTRPTRPWPARARAASGGRCTTPESARSSCRRPTWRRAHRHPRSQLRDARHAGAGARDPAGADVSRQFDADASTGEARPARRTTASSALRARADLDDHLPTLRDRPRRRLRRRRRAREPRLVPRRSRTTSTASAGPCRRRSSRRPAERR